MLYSEDIQKMGGMEALDAPYMESRFGPIVRKRGGWLALLFCGQMLTVAVMAYYAEAIEQAVVLAVFVPLDFPLGTPNRQLV